MIDRNDLIIPVIDIDYKISCIGLTKRELFAAMAMQGFCVNGEIKEEIIRCSVDMADLLIKELNK